MPLNSWTRTAFWCAFSLLGMVAMTGSARAQPPGAGVSGLPEELMPALEPIIKAALTRSPDAIRNTIEIERAEARTLIMGTPARWPTLAGSARYAVNEESISGVNGTTNRTSGFFYNIDFYQPLYQWGALKAQEEQWKIGTKMKEREFAEGFRALVLRLRREFLELVARKAALRALRYQLTLDTAHVAHEEERLKARAATEGDVAVAKLTLEQHQLDLDVAQSAYGFAKRSLLRLAGVTELADDAIPEELPRPKANDALGAQLLRAFTQGGVMNTFQVQVDTLGIKQAEESYIVAKHRLHPKFSLFAGYNVRSETQATTSFIDQVAVASRNYGLKADWAIFDGWATKGEKRQALANKRSYEKLQEVHVEAMTDAARTQHEQLGLSARQLAAAERGLDGARALFKRAQDELAAGRAAQADVDRAQLNLLQAEGRILPSRIDYLYRCAEFVSLVGADPAMNHLPARYVR